MRWSDSAVTDAGNTMLCAALYGHQLTITKAVGGRGITDVAALASLIELADPIQQLILFGAEDIKEGKVIKIQVRNHELEEAYLLQQIAVYARLDNSDEEVLFFVMQDDRGVDIPSAAEVPDFLFEIYASISMSNTANVVVEIGAKATISPAELDERLNNFFVIGNVEPTTGPALWFDTSVVQQSEEVLLLLGEDSDNTEVSAEIDGSEYSVDNADV